jgi:hypothetical protein
MLVPTVAVVADGLRAVVVAVPLVDTEVAADVDTPHPVHVSGTARHKLQRIPCTARLLRTLSIMALTPTTVC